MEFVPESIIDTYIEKFQDEAVYQTYRQKMEEENVILSQYLHPDRLELLSEKELSVLELITGIIYFSSREIAGKSLFVQGQLLEEKEDINWEAWNLHIKKSVTHALDVFFENYFQEDLLAFVEDSLQPDEDAEVSPAGAEIILVTAKSIIDTLDQLN